MCTTTQLVGVCGITSGNSLFDGSCWTMTDADVAAFPNMGFKFDQISTPIEITPNDYLVEEQGFRCLFVAPLSLADMTMCSQLQSMVQY